MRILLTRPKQDSDRLSSMLKKSGHTTVISPLLEISFLNVDGVIDADIQAIVSTSRHGLKGISKVPNFRNLTSKPLFSVGLSTEKAGIKLGFKNISSADGYASDLIELVKQNCRPENGTLFYPRGSHISLDLEQELRSSGFQVISPVVYKSNAASDMTDQFWTELEAGTLEGAILLSPRTAQIYSQLIIKREREAFASKLIYFCLSKRVADKISIPGISIKSVPARPRIRELLDLIDSK